MCAEYNKETFNQIADFLDNAPNEKRIISDRIETLALNKIHFSMTRLTESQILKYNKYIYQSFITHSKY